MVLSQGTAENRRRCPLFPIDVEGRLWSGINEEGCLRKVVCRGEPCVRPRVKRQVGANTIFWGRLASHPRDASRFFVPFPPKRESIDNEQRGQSWVHGLYILRGQSRIYESYKTGFRNSWDSPLQLLPFPLPYVTERGSRTRESRTHLAGSFPPPHCHSRSLTVIPAKAGIHCTADTVHVGRYIPATRRQDLTAFAISPCGNRRKRAASARVVSCLPLEGEKAECHPKHSA